MGSEERALQLFYTLILLALTKLRKPGIGQKSFLNRLGDLIPCGRRLEQLRDIDERAADTPKPLVGRSAQRLIVVENLARRELYQTVLEVPPIGDPTRVCLPAPVSLNYVLRLEVEEHGKRLRIDEKTVL